MIARCIALCLISAAAAPLLADPPPAAPAPAPLAQQNVLDGLVGKRRVVGITERSGRRFLGRVLSADHGLYLVQTFHYASTPATVTRTTTQTEYVPDRRGRLRPVTRKVKTPETTQKTIADDTAVRALLSGVAGPSFVPSEQPGQREIVAPADVTFLQELSPPAPAGAAKPSSSAWTIKTLWAAPALPKRDSQSNKRKSSK